MFCYFGDDHSRPDLITSAFMPKYVLLYQEVNVGCNQIYFCHTGDLPMKPALSNSYSLLLNILFIDSIEPAISGRLLLREGADGQLLNTVASQ